MPLKHVIREYDNRIRELVAERDDLLIKMAAIRAAAKSCQTLDLGVLTRCMAVIQGIVEDDRG